MNVNIFGCSLCHSYIFYSPSVDGEHVLDLRHYFVPVPVSREEAGDNGDLTSLSSRQFECLVEFIVDEWLKESTNTHQMHPVQFISLCNLRALQEIHFIYTRK